MSTVVAEALTRRTPAIILQRLYYGSAMPDIDTVEDDDLEQALVLARTED
jgi:hypothetical protein